MTLNATKKSKKMLQHNKTSSCDFICDLFFIHIVISSCETSRFYCTFAHGKKWNWWTDFGTTRRILYKRHERTV